MTTELLNNKQVQLLLGTLQIAVLGLLGWAGLTIIELQNKITALETRSENVKVLRDELNVLKIDMKIMNSGITENKVLLKEINKKLERRF
jgi:protein involved in polysaccharide export with SLBB domain